MVNLDKNSKVVIEGVEGHLIKDALGTRCDNGYLVDVPNSLGVFKRPAMLKCSYSEEDVKERAQYVDAPRLKVGDEVLVEGVKHVVEFKNSYSWDFATLVEAV